MNNLVTDHKKHSCAEHCTNDNVPYCHCLSCGDTGIDLTDEGDCESCAAPTENEW